MRTLLDMLWVEFHKALRSRVPLFTSLGFLLMPFIAALMIFIYKDPTLARQLGLLGAKANLVVGSADWPGYLTMLIEFTALGGFFFFFLAISWVFGREFSDGTLKDLLAVPVPRLKIVFSKFIVASVWCAGMILGTYLVGLALGAIIQLPGASSEVLLQGSARLLLVSLLTIILVLPFGWLASLGRGYLLPMGIAVIIMILANLSNTLGWAAYFPWAIPGMLFQNEQPGILSYLLVGFTGLFGVIGTYLWWMYADQNR